MASGWTNKGAAHVLGIVFRNVAEKTNYYIALVTSAASPTVDTNTLSQLTEIANGNGYTTGGYQLTPGSTDFDVITEDDTNDLGLVQVKDVVWTASGGTLPASGSGARWAVLVDDNVTIGSREVYAWWDLTSDRSVSSGQTLTLQDLQLTIDTVP
jgi:hypothetical protein